MVLIDTSVWINVFADKQGDYSSRLNELLAGREVYLTRFQQLELLQGCRSEQEWGKLSNYLDGQDYLETQADTWQAAARIYYDLRKMGITIRSPIDCCIAQIAMEHKILLIHDDRDFTAIASHFPLQQKRWLRSEAEDSKLHEASEKYNPNDLDETAEYIAISSPETTGQVGNIMEKEEQKLEALRQALTTGENSGKSKLLDIEEIRINAKKKAGLAP